MSIENVVKNAVIETLKSNVTRLRISEYFTDAYFAVGAGLTASSLVTTYLTSYKAGNTVFIDTDSYLSTGFLIATSGLLLRMYAHWAKEGTKAILEQIK